MRCLNFEGKLNTEDYIFLFGYLSVTPICEVYYDRTLDKLILSNTINITITFSEEDISMYKPGGVGAISSEISFKRRFDKEISGE